MPEPFADRLVAAIRAKNAPVCVGFDPLVSRLPRDVLPGLDRIQDSQHDRRPGFEELAGAVVAFGHGVIDAVAPLVPAIKINIAFFEPLYAEGINAYHALVAYARDAGLLVIGDVKRADIGHTTAQYADAQLGSMQPIADSVPVLPDAVTVNPYFGIDGVQPFIDRARELDRGVFVLVQTSNESAASIQGLPVGEGELLTDRVAAMVEQWASAPTLIGASRYSCVGAVVSPRDVSSTRRIRALMPHCLFLVPGFGAQGRTADEVAECFKEDGTGAIVNASRSVIYAFEQADGVTDWRTAISHACNDFVDRVRSAVAGARS